MTSRRRIGVVMAGLLAVLLVHNLVLLVRNQLVFDRDHRIAVQRPTLEQIATADNHPWVHGQAAVLYLLHERLAGATVVLAGRLHELRWWFERVSRVKVEISAIRLPLKEHAAEALIAEASTSRTLWLLGRERPIHFLFVDGETRYVIAETRQKGPFILLPESRYRQVAPPSLRRQMGWP